ncbi:MAG TPA: succinylglutamate desuccinylase/aspartoacylase family protein [Usitatibacteraceae bacterium]|nr:succinylglutamate desuccinylase/aspartoacylase family protein [Usitatibacteraceae bacterium]
MRNPPDVQFCSIRYTGLVPGPRLIITGAVHGNEICGPIAIRRVVDEIDRGTLKIRAGTVTFVPVTNPLAYAHRRRIGDRNLNRNLAPTGAPKDFEDHVANWLCPLLAEHEILLDLHSTTASNPAFAMLGPPDNSGPLEPFRHFAAERAMAAHLGVHRFVDGWLSTYAIGVERRRASGHGNPLNTDAKYGVGTTEYMRSVGGYAITLECGQHDAPESPEVGYRAIRNVLAFLGLSGEPPPGPVTGAEQLHMYEVIDREHPGDRFERNWGSFDPLAEGQLIGTRHDGREVRAPAAGCILFPDARAHAGHEWFYLARRVS